MHCTVQLVSVTALSFVSLATHASPPLPAFIPTGNAKVEHTASTHAIELVASSPATALLAQDKAASTPVYPVLQLKVQVGVVWLVNCPMASHPCTPVGKTYALHEFSLQVRSEVAAVVLSVMPDAHVTSPPFPLLVYPAAHSTAHEGVEIGVSLTPTLHADDELECACSPAPKMYGRQASSTQVITSFASSPATESLAHSRVPPADFVKPVPQLNAQVGVVTVEGMQLLTSKVTPGVKVGFLHVTSVHVNLPIESERVSWRLLLSHV
jgi:hypothetical protein